MAALGRPEASAHQRPPHTGPQASPAAGIPGWLHGHTFEAMRHWITATALLACVPLMAQPLKRVDAYTRADTLRGSIGPYRAWWDVVHYAITVRPDHGSKTIQGSNTILIRAVHDGQRMQIDLQQPLVVDSIKADVAAPGAEGGRGGGLVPFTRDGNVIWADLPGTIGAGSEFAVHIYYHGKPREARNPPWDGGWIWARTPDGRPWMTVACQGLGASAWYPCKDTQSDEPDSAALHIVVPDSLTGVGNGSLHGTTPNGDGTTTWHWKVANPINNYNLVPYIGPYTHIGRRYKGADGPLDLDYWVLPSHLAKALEQFNQVPPMLACFEDWFGPYPFYTDGYKLVEAPHLGMEHQSGIAYGNGYMNGYLGTDLSGSGWGLKWDYIIVHESAHEWFGNNITTADIADMWVHEAFANYAEALYTECLFGAGAGADYVTGLRKNVLNDIPVQGRYGVNQEGSRDMYYKGSNMLHTIRHIMDDDSLFKGMLREMNRRFRHGIVTGAQIEAFISTYSGHDFSKVFDQYLRSTQVPVLQWGVRKGRLYVRFTQCLEDFAMPTSIIVNGETRTVPIGTRWSSPAGGLRARTATLEPDRNWYVGVQAVRGRELKQAIGASLPHHPD